MISQGALSAFGVDHGGISKKGFQAAGKLVKTGPKHRSHYPDTTMSPFAAASQRNRAGLPAVLPGRGKRMKVTT